MKILGIDPGYDRLGIAVIGKEPRKKEVLLYSECFQTSSKQDFYERVEKIGTEVSKIMDEYDPDALSIENLYIDNNQKTAMRVSETRGVILYEAQKRQIPIFEYTPMQIKTAVTGDGRSDKRMMAKMVSLLISMPMKKVLDDEYDAIAVALTHSAIAR